MYAFPNLPVAVNCSLVLQTMPIFIATNVVEGVASGRVQACRGGCWHVLEHALFGPHNAALCQHLVAVMLADFLSEFHLRGRLAIIVIVRV